LRDRRQLEEEYDRWRRGQPVGLSAEEREAIRALSADLPALWHAPTTTAVDREQVVRHLLDRGGPTGRGQTESVDVRLEWAGGYTSQHQMARSVGRYEQLADFAGLMARIAGLRAEGRTASEIATTLRAEGWRSPRRAARFSGAMVSELLARR